MATDLKEVFRGKFILLLKSTQLSPLAEEDHKHFVLSLAKSYGLNNAVLKCRQDQFNNATKLLKEIQTNLSFNTIGVELRQSVTRLAEHSLKTSLSALHEILNYENIFDLLDLNSINAEVNTIFERLTANIGKYTVFMRINGVELQVNKFSVGKVTIFPSLKQLQDDYQDELNDKNPLWKPIIDDFGDRVGDCDGYISVTNLEGDVDYVEELALRRVNNTIHILNFYANFFAKKHFESLTLKQASNHEQIILALNMETPRVSFHTFGSTLLKNVINPVLIAKFKEYCFDEIVNCFEADENDTNAIVKAIKQAVIWYSKALTSTSIEEGFICLNIALENLLILEESNVGITDRLGDRVAFLLGNSLNMRLQLKERVSSLYKMRGSLVHKGLDLPISEVNINEMAQLTHSVIIAFTSKKFQTREDFFGWEKQQKYGLSTDTQD